MSLRNVTYHWLRLIVIRQVIILNVSVVKKKKTSKMKQQETDKEIGTTTILSYYEANILTIHSHTATLHWLMNANDDVPVHKASLTFYLAYATPYLSWPLPTAATHLPSVPSPPRPYNFSNSYMKNPSPRNSSPSTAPAKWQANARFSVLFEECVCGQTFVLPDAGSGCWLCFVDFCETSHIVFCEKKCE